MCNHYVLDFVKKQFEKHITKSNYTYFNGDTLRILEVGSRNVNGTARDVIDKATYKEWIGVDIEAGPNVDRIMSVYDLSQNYGVEFDVVICTEMMEHVESWPSALLEMSRVLKDGGYLIVTSPSKGFIYHGYPNDYWRYQKEDMERIFNSRFIMRLIECESNDDPGVGAIVKKDCGSGYCELAWYFYLVNIDLYNINLDKRIRYEEYKWGRIVDSWRDKDYYEKR
jgi:SAM-dependent methyltransferase